MDLNTILSWFKRGCKPTEAQFAATFRSFRHKDDPVPMEDVTGLSYALANKSEKGHTHTLAEITDYDGGDKEVLNAMVANDTAELEAFTKTVGMYYILLADQTLYQYVRDEDTDTDTLTEVDPDGKVVYSAYDADDNLHIYLYNVPNMEFQDVTNEQVDKTIYTNDLDTLITRQLKNGIYSVVHINSGIDDNTYGDAYTLTVGDGSISSRVLECRSGWAQTVLIDESYQWEWHRYAYTGHKHQMSDVEGLSAALDDKQDKTDNSLPTTSKTIIGAITELWNKFANYALANHNHDGVYQPAGNYAASDHTHSQYLTQHQDISGKQDKTDNSLLTTVKTIVGAINELWTKFKDYLKGIQHVTHAELVALRDNGELVPGQRYRITDYTCTTKQPETHSAGHVFDIIVTADDVSTLNENARAVKHTGDTYFSGSKLSTWKLKYCLDNDITRFAWADTESGKGVIYYLEDEFGNLAEYDFKNIQFKRYRATIKEEYEGILGDSKFMFLQDNDEGWYDINDSVFELDTDDYIWCYTFHDIVNGNKDGSLNHFDGEAYNPRGVFKNSIPCNRISVSYDEVLYTSLYLSNIVHYVTLPTGDDYDTEGIWTCGNEFGIECQNLTFSKKCRNSKFIGSIRNTTFGGNIENTTFGGYIWGTTFGGGIYYATFGGYINGATFGGEIRNTTFGGYIYEATFGGYIERATFGGHIDGATFGGDIWDTTFGGDIGNTTFGGYIGNTTFGGNIGYTTFGGYINRATFGGYIDGATFGGNLYNGHIHGRLYSVSIGSAGETWSNLVIDPGVEYVSVTCTESGDADIKNVHIFGGVSGTDDNQITVSIPTRNNALLEIKPTTKTEILV